MNISPVSFRNSLNFKGKLIENKAHSDLISKNWAYEEHMEVTKLGLDSIREAIYDAPNENVYSLSIYECKSFVDEQGEIDYFPWGYEISVQEFDKNNLENVKEYREYIRLGLQDFGERVAYRPAHVLSQFNLLAGKIKKNTPDIILKSKDKLDINA